MSNYEGLAQASFDVYADDTHLGKLTAYLFDGMGEWFEIGFDFDSSYFDVEKLELEDLDIEEQGWMGPMKDSDFKTTEDALALLNPLPS